MGVQKAGQQGGAGGDFLSKLRALDAFPKVNEDFFQKTMSGGIITMIAYAFMLLLFLTETREWPGFGGASGGWVGGSAARAACAQLVGAARTTTSLQTHTHTRASPPQASTWLSTGITSWSWTRPAGRPSAST
jgi:hypothetical protein